MRRDKLQGIAFKSVSREYWQKVHDEFGALDVEAQEDLEARAANSVFAAAAGRDEKKRKRLRSIMSINSLSLVN